MAKKTKQGKTTFFIKVAIVVNFVVALMILLAIMASRVSPEKNYILAFFGLAYPLILYVNIAFIIVWALLRKKWFLISAISILAGFNTLSSFFQMNLSRCKSPEGKETFTVVSYNVQSFREFYNHQNTEYIDSLINFLHKFQPDVICFQEFYNDLQMKPEDITSTFKRELNLKYDCTEDRVTRCKRYQFGMAMFSKYPIISTGRILNSNYNEDFITTNFAMYSDLVINQDTFRVYNIHLESLRISEESEIFQFIEEGKTDNFRQESMKFFSKLKNAFVFRAKQIKPIREHIDQSPYPVIICGDFNDTPSSWAYRQMSLGLNDAFVEAGRGAGKSYNGKYPSFRIDYILTAPEIEVHWFETPHAEFSDHFPVYAICSLGKDN